MEQLLARVLGVDPGGILTLRVIEGRILASFHDVPVDRVLPFFGVVERLDALLPPSSSRGPDVP